MGLKLDSLINGFAGGLVNLGKVEIDILRCLANDTGKITTVTNGEVVTVERFGKVIYQKDERKEER
jgi:hypothetical protein